MEILACLGNHVLDFAIVDFMTQAQRDRKARELMTLLRIEKMIEQGEEAARQRKEKWGF